MNSNRLLRIGLILFSCSAALPAAEPALSELLRDALYTEEVARDSDKAAEQYEELLARHDAQKTFAAAALFRLAEVRRKQDRKDDAIQLYQRLITEFPNAETETRLAKENLLALGGKMPSVEAVADDPETAEIRRLEELLKNSPDLVNQDTLNHAATLGRIKVVTWLIQVAKVEVAASYALQDAALSGHARIIEKLVELSGEDLKPEMPYAMEKAISEGHIEVVRTLLRLGADPNAANQVASMQKNGYGIDGGRPLIRALAGSHFKIVDILLEAEADVKSPEGPNRVTPLLAAARNTDAAPYLERLLAMGADVNAEATLVVEEHTGSQPAKRTLSISPLQVAAWSGSSDALEILIKRGADTRKTDFFEWITTSTREEREVGYISALVDVGVNPNLPISDGRSVLAWAVGWEDSALVKLLLAKGADPNVPIRPESENTSDPNLTQYVAMDSDGSAELLKLLLDAGGDPNVAPIGEWMLRLVAKSGNEDAEDVLARIKLLVQKGLIPEATWREDGFSGAGPETKAYLEERFPDTTKETESKPTH